MRQSDVSVIIPLYQRRDLVPLTLASLAPSVQPGIELDVIVVDDGSTDGGAEEVERRFPSVRVERQPNGGASAARNLGIALATAPTIFLLDSDDLIEPDFFGPRLAALAEHPDADGAYGPWVHFTGNEEFAESLVAPRKSQYPLERTTARRSHIVRLLGGWYIPAHAILWRTSAVRAVGGHDPQLSVNQDVDFLFRVLLNGNGIVGCDAPRALYRDHSGPRQGTVRTPKRARDVLLLRQRFARELEARGELDAETREALSRYCFGMWRENRHVAPHEAHGLLQLSRSLWPSLIPRSRLPIRALAHVIGSARAVQVEDALRTAARQLGIRP